MRQKVRITVLKKEFYPEIADAYLTAGREAGPCPILNEGDSFVYAGGAVMPEGFCPWAWTELYSKVNAMAGRVENNWYKPNVSIGCCSDGVRPVVFCLKGLNEPNEEAE